MSDIKTKIRRELVKNKGVLRLIPAFVGRTALLPGKRLKLDVRDIYARGASFGGLSERWLASTGMADNGPTTWENEGLSCIAVQTSAGIEKLLLKDAIDEIGDEILGEDVMNQYGGLMAFAKLFDFKTPIPHHLHLMERDAAVIGANPKPEAYYFPVELNSIDYDGAYTFFGLEPGTTKQQLKRYLENWGAKGDNGILEISRAYRLKLGTGWDVPAGILHAPGSLVTYEPQRVSDISLFWQSMIQDHYFEHDLLVRFIPEDKKNDLDYIIDCLDWEANVDPDFKKNHYHEPLPVADTEEMAEAGYESEWIAYGSKEFSAKKLTVYPGREVTIQEASSYGFIAMQGYGSADGIPVETPSVIRYERPTRDEYFVTKQAANRGVAYKNYSDTADLVLYMNFGPDNKDSKKFAL